MTFHTNYGQRSKDKWTSDCRLPGRMPEQYLSRRTQEKDNDYTQDTNQILVLTLYTDGASGNEGAGADLILTDPEGNEITHALRFEFPTSNNESEYEAIILGTYEAREESMKQYLAKVYSLQERFKSFSIMQIPRSKIKSDNTLSELASLSFAHLTKKVLVEVIPCRSTDMKMVNTVEEPETTWMDSIINYLRDGHLLEDMVTVRKIRVKSPQYSLRQVILYRKGYLTPWMRCVGPNQAQYVLQEAHFMSCGAHAGARTIAQKVARLGYFWPTMYNDATKVVNACVTCQEHAPVMRKPQCDMANGQNEITNRTLLQGVKTQLGKAKGQWVEELPNLPWAYRTTARTSHQCTSFSLVYGSEAVGGTKRHGNTTRS
ncbi:reverse transcriptase domain-containing protein [Tanacetum coccineum]